MSNAISNACLLIFLSFIAARFLLLRLPELNNGIVACIVAPVEELMDEPAFDVILPVMVGLKILCDASTLYSEPFSCKLAARILG